MIDRLHRAGAFPLGVDAKLTLPELPAVNLLMTYPALTPDDGERGWRSRKGSDYTQTLQLREYVPRGILSKQIHWKLSSKLDKTIVRDPSFPVSRSLLLFWDKAARVAEAAEMNAMAECVCGISRAASKQGFALYAGLERRRDRPADAGGFRGRAAADDAAAAEIRLPDAASSAPQLSGRHGAAVQQGAVFHGGLPERSGAYLLCRQRAHGAVLRRSGPGGRLPRDRLYAGKLPAAIAGFGLDA